MCYYKVYLIFKKSIEGNNNLTSDVSVKEKASNLQKKVLIKCVTITGVFLTFWFPMAIKMLYETFLGSRMANEEYIAIANQFLTFNCTLDPIVLYLLDNRIKGDIRKFLRLPNISSSYKSKLLNSKGSKSGKKVNQSFDLAKTKLQTQTAIQRNN